MFSDFDDDLFAPATKAVASSGPVIASNWTDEDAFRSPGVFSGELLTLTALKPSAEFVKSAPLLVKAVAPIALAPALPPSPYFLEKTHLRSFAPAHELLSVLKRVLGSQPTAALDSNDSKFKVCCVPARNLGAAHALFSTQYVEMLVFCGQISCSLVREYVGFEVVVRVFSDNAVNERVAEFQCMHARGRVAFFQLFNEVADALAAEGLIERQSAPKFGRAVAVKPLELPEELSTSPDFSRESMSPILSMVRCACSDVRREGVAVLAQLLGSASPRSVERMVAAGALDALREVQSTVETDFEARSNCAVAIAKLSVA